MRTTERSDPLTPFIQTQGVVVLDGGLATELEARGQLLDDDLWSARILEENPELIRQVHLDYLRAGADCVVSASYQATFEGFARRGFSDQQVEQLLHLSVSLCLQAREIFWAETTDSSRLHPLVAASVGPYGAFLADGSEYTGDYGLDRSGLRDFHRQRLAVLAASGADLLACETVPSLEEARALCDLLDESDGIPAWLTFSCRDHERICDGTPFVEAVEVALDCSRVIAVGVNCTSPIFISELLSSVGSITKPLAVYPNSGEGWNAIDKRWTDVDLGGDPAVLCSDWRALGAELLGGCCRTDPAAIGSMRTRLLSSSQEGG
jgi:homocysteine S-methyltransferase